MSGKIVLVTGGARSGKSAFAEKYAQNVNKKTAYFATAQIFDEEMKERIARHRSRRPQEWATYETPFDAEEEMAKVTDTFDVVLFDCLTIYLSNLFLSPAMPAARHLRQEAVLAKMEKLMRTAKAGKAEVVFVTNEVGLGIVPDNPLAREYRDLAGLVNQKAASFAAEVYLIVCGMPLQIK
ncbi:MAG: bifunctional adenosylcobinamide kinase/adenosylcobinamide-phosphate guanylyltransferase [Sporomusaceae bacterium]|jgi:adenosylcobinamide kinase/adenosylcobinamide-phosphate guanylyltransferase|nr:bifunctional adenosylcobinamide kinase/adenosylcobinamide-phosphate guanylyltransferase [Sporomusaceae bacterium]